ncbi:hypothetical protein GCM10009112_11200 [Marinomonas arenicola]
MKKFSIDNLSQRNHNAFVTDSRQHPVDKKQRSKRLAHLLATRGITEMAEKRNKEAAEKRKY